MQSSRVADRCAGNCNRIVIVKDSLPDGTTRVAVFDNGSAHDDTLAACYDNALSLVCEKKPHGRIPNQNGNGGAGSSKNGLGAGTALKHLVSATNRRGRSMMQGRLPPPYLHGAMNQSRPLRRPLTWCTSSGVTSLFATA